MLERAVAAGISPGAVAVVGRGRKILAEIAAGSLGRDDDDRVADAETVYDLSSLTKPLVTSALTMMLVAEGACSPDQSAAKYLPSISRAITLAQLLSHCSGLPAWRPFYDGVKAAEAAGAHVLMATEAAKHVVYGLAERVPLQAPPGTRPLYSDVGYILLGSILEKIVDEPLHHYARRRLFDPLGLSATSFVAAYEPAHAAGRIDAAKVAPCGKSLARETPVCGFVHDDTAYAMGGVSGHAGLFSNAREVHALVAEHVEAQAGGASLLDRGVVDDFWAPSKRLPNSTWALGWDTPTAGNSTAGKLISPQSIGHLGFTGTSIWVDRVRGVHVVLLTNRLQAGAERGAVNDMRARFHDAVFTELDQR